MKDPFKFDLRLRHPSLDPRVISSTLGLEPKISWQAGSKVGSIVHKHSVWRGTAFEGKSIKEFERALSKAVEFLEAKQVWLSDFMKSEGELNLIISLWTDIDEGKTCEVAFYPELLSRLAKLGAGLNVEVWKDE